ncbi:Galactose mutarotase [Halotydeus destructor]|nr:Galactose mutarotase [Halotydeus destructor]
MTHGATLTNLFVPDQDGVSRDIVLGFDDLDGYLSPLNRYKGATCGRIANRIANGQFELNGTKYQLDINGGPNNLHGGFVGFDKKNWDAKILDANSVEFTVASADGDQNYPGALVVKVVYSVLKDELHLKYDAELVEGETKSTIINLTNHSYFNLGGCKDESSAKIEDHFVSMSKHVVGHLDKDVAANIPTGKVIEFDGQDSGSMYFGPRSDGKTKTIGEGVNQASGGGYDHCYVVEGHDLTTELVKVWSPKTGIFVSLRTTEPSFQLYSGDNNSAQLQCKKTQNETPFTIGTRSAVCLEAQRYPDAINKPEWRDQVIIKPGEKYEQHTVYQFGIVASL